jgi:tRNA U34 5-carboxymethylaminomethyl modifying enzyme MnmG/GidA
MKKTIFISSRWIKFLLNGETCIGRTFLHDKKEKEVILNQLVILITENRKTKVINFCECIEIKYLEFVQKQAQIKDLKINNENLSIESSIDLLINPNITKKTITELAKKQISKISRN